MTRQIGKIFGCDVAYIGMEHACRRATLPPLRAGEQPSVGVLMAVTERMYARMGIAIHHA